VLLTLFVVGSLVLSSFLVGGALNAFDVSIPAQGNYRSAPPPQLPHGTLVVRVLLANSSFPRSTPDSNLVAVPDEHIWLASIDHQLDRRIFLYTNSTGMLQMEIVPLSLLVEVLDDRFNVVVPVQVLANQVSTVTIVGTRVDHAISFAELTDSQRIYVAIRSSGGSVNATDFVFIEHPPQGTSPPPSPVRAILLGEEQSKDLLWLQIRPSVSVPISALTGAELVTYQTTFTVVVTPGKADS
jgi:hypothetical protein